MITNTQLANAYTKPLNDRLNFPILNEVSEGEYIHNALLFICPAIPERIRPILLDGADGLSDDERDSHAADALKTAYKMIIARVPVVARPFISGRIHDELKSMVDIVFEYAQTGFELVLDSE